MSESQQIIYMQARILRLASEEWNLPVKAVISIFSKYHILQYIRDCFDSFHVEGDQTILEEITSYVQSKGEQLHEEID